MAAATASCHGILLLFYGLAQSDKHVPSSPVGTNAPPLPRRLVHSAGAPQAADER